ncbi:MAG: type II/IV secretion system protein, partial [Planctomycetaceae bacterium]|nr:type II/IV secretion system protein [Planctomycetaceae bacterium]
MSAELAPSEVPVRFTSMELRRARDLYKADGHFEQFAFEQNAEHEQDVIERIADALGLLSADLTSVQADSSLVSRFPVKLIHRHGIFPLRMTDGVLELALADPFDTQAIDAASAAVGLSVIPVLVAAKELATLIKSQFGVGAETLDGMLAQTAANESIEIVDDLEWDQSEAAEMAQQASVVRLVNEILTEAVEARASDIHLEAQARGMKIRYRIDGVLQTQPVPAELNRF